MYNKGNSNSGSGNSGLCNSGNSNSGSSNSGSGNSGWHNSGLCNSGSYNSGSYNSGSYNSGWDNSGDFNSCNYSSGFFCKKTPKAILFDCETNMTVDDFRRSNYYEALQSSKFILTEWVKYTDEEMENDTNKRSTGGYLKTYTYKEACANWWENMSKGNKKIIKSIPNFNADIFEEITGIKV